MNRFAWLFIAVFAVVALWCGGWFFGASFVRGEIEAQKQAAPAIACADLTVAGFPFRFDITCTGATLADEDMTVAVDEVRATVLVYNLTFAEVFARGPASLTDAFTGAAYRLDWQNLQASIRLDWTALARASLVADGLVLSDTVLDVTEIARVKHAEFHAVGAAGAASENARNLRVFARVEEADFAQLDDPLRLETAVLVTEWPKDLRDWGSREALRLWAAGDGVIEIESADLLTGDLMASLSGRLEPDAAGLIDGNLDLVSRGFGPLMREYLAAPLAGALLGPEDADGESRQTLSVSRSILRAGIVPLIAVPPLF